jgi:hypothetical protein
VGISSVHSWILINVQLDAPTINTEISRFKVKEKALDKASDDKMRGLLFRILIGRTILIVPAGFLKTGKSPMKWEAEEAL